MRQREKSNNNNRRGGGWHGIKEKRKDFLVYKDSCAQEGGEDVNIHKVWEFVAPSLYLMLLCHSLLSSLIALLREEKEEKTFHFPTTRGLVMKATKVLTFSVFVCPPPQMCGWGKGGAKSNFFIRLAISA